LEAVHLLETVAWISIIIGFVIVIAFSMAAMFLMRRKEQNTPKAVDYDEAVGKVDAAADAALTELNKTAELVLKDIDEKYQTLLFLYELTEEKLKAAGTNAEAEISAAAARRTGRYAAPPAGKPAIRYTASGNNSGRGPLDYTRDKAARVKKPPVLNAKQSQILKLYGEGMASAEIAKVLDIGQGEVKLVIDLAERG
jgi:DNA-directed RNA polymerase specialized sigma24 family protein